MLWCTKRLTEPRTAALAFAGGRVEDMSSVLRLKGSEHFRQRIVCSTLSARPIVIEDIRSDTEEPGLRGEQPHFHALPPVIILDV